MDLKLDPAVSNHKFSKNIADLKRKAAVDKKNAAEVKKAEDKKLKEACADFESIFIEMMMKSMRNTLPGDSIFEKGLADDIYQSMHDQKLSEKIARGRNNIGLGDSLYRQLTKNKADSEKKDISSKKTEIKKDIKAK